MSQPIPFDVTVVVSGGAGEAKVTANGWAEKTYISAPGGASYRLTSRDGLDKPTGDSGPLLLSGPDFISAKFPLRNNNTIRIVGTDGSYPVTLWVNQW